MLIAIRLRLLPIIKFAVFAAVCFLFVTSAKSQSIPSTLGWYQIPNTTLADVCAGTHGFPSVFGSTGCAAITSAWNSGVYDSAGNRLIIWGGGHNDYYGNEVYALNLGSLVMQRLNNPSLPVATSCVDTLSDGKPNARHTGDSIAYIAHLNRMFVKGGVPACPGGGYVQGTWTLDLNTMTWNQRSTINTTGTTVVSAYDPVTKKVYVHDDTRFYSYTYETNTWATLKSGAASMPSGHSVTAEIDPVKRKFVMIGAGLLSVYDLNTLAFESWTTTGASSIVSSNAPGLAYDSSTGEMIAWNGGNTIYRLNMDTRQWTTVTYSAGPAVMSNGTYGRFAYVPSKNVFATCNSVSVSCSSLRLTSGSGTPTPPPGSFDFNLTNGGNVSATQGQSTSNIVTATLVSGTPQTASFSVSGLPSGATGPFTQASCSPTCSSTLNISTASSTPVGSYTVSVTSVAGSLTRATSFVLTVSATLPPPTGSADFQTRCSQPSVLKCVPFDSQSEIAGTYGDVSGILTGPSNPVIDSTVKASGNSSLKFTIPSNSGANSSGSYFTNFSNNLSTQFGQNSEFYVQWRQRFSPEFLSTFYQGGGGWKQAIIGTGDKPGCTSSQSAGGLCYSSCSSLETVTQNTDQRGFAQMYNSCSGSTSHGPYDGFYQPFGSFDFKIQNARPAPYCLYSQGQTNPKTYFPPTGNCFGYFPNEWMTFQVRIKTGPRVNDEFTNSFVQLWIARENQPSELVLNWGPYNLTAGSASENQQYGKVWLLPYHTGKSSAQSHPTAYTWYDELIISTSKIADPSAGSGTPTSPPAAPTTLTLQ